MESIVPEYMLSGHIRKRTGSVLEGVAPSNVYPCTDGEYLIGANQDAVFGRLCRAMGAPELAQDPRYATHLARGVNQKELDDRISLWTQTFTIDGLEALMIEHSVPAGKIYRAPDMLEDPHFAAREALIEVDSPRWGKFKMQNTFPKLSDTPSSVRSLAPSEIGQHNDEIYRGLLGMDEAEMSRLKDAGAI
jgi:formyl-CoA transferase